MSEIGYESFAGYDIPLLKTQQQLLGLNDGQMSALIDAATVVNQSDVMQRLISVKLSELADLQITSDQKVDSKELHDVFGEHADMFNLLTLIARLPWLMQKYQEYGISEDVLRDTLSDLGIWMNTCKRRTGHWGLLEYGWLCNHFRIQLFRIGRLQYILKQSTIPAKAYRNSRGEVIALALHDMAFRADGEANGSNGIFDDNAWHSVLLESDQSVTGNPIYAHGAADAKQITLDKNEWHCILQPGDMVLDMHIPEGQPLSPESVTESLDASKQFFAAYFPDRPPVAFGCESWLLDWALPILVPNSNLAKFQQRFYCVPFAGSDHQTFERAFGSKPTNMIDAPEDSTLRKAIKGWYLQGNLCRDAYGFIPIDMNSAYKRPDSLFV